MEAAARPGTPPKGLPVFPSRDIPIRENSRTPQRPMHPQIRARATAGPTSVIPDSTCEMPVSLVKGQRAGFRSFINLSADASQIADSL